MKKKPWIGCIPLVDNERESYWMLPGYMEGITLAGGIPIMLPLIQEEDTIAQLAEQCDGFLLTGGHDVSPELYGEEILPECGECSTERDQMEQRLLKIALELDKPVLGICRGIQFLNAALEGTLYQDIPSQLPSNLEHHQKPPYHIPSHKVEIYEGTPLYELVQKQEMWVNSYHHQGIKKLSRFLRVMACAPEGLVEAVYMPEKKFVWGVQWHPEFSYKTDEDSARIFRAFVNAAKV